MKKVFLNAIKSIVIILDLIAVLFVVSLFYPFATNGFTIETEEPYYSFENTTIIFSMPVHVENKGPWAITNVMFQYEIFNGSYIYSNNTQKIPNLINSLNITLNIEMDLAKVYNIDRSMFFNNKELNITYAISGYYALNMIYFKINGKMNLSWFAPIQNFTFYKNYTILQENSYSILYLPFSIFTASYLNGSAEIQSSIYVNSTFISSTNFSVPLGEIYHGMAEFIIPNEKLNYLLNNISYAYIKNILEFKGLRIEFLWGD